MAETYSSQHSPHLAHRQRSCNSILTKDDVGRAPPSCRDLPPPEHAYGVSESWSTGGEGTRDALTWRPHWPSAPARPEADFQRLNKVAAMNQVTTPKSLSQFRSSHGDFARLPLEPMPRSPAVIPSDVIPHWAYGKRSRPSTPVGAVLAHEFGNQCEEALEQRYLRYDEIKRASDVPLKIKLTKAAGSQRRKEKVEPIEPMMLWKMSKFNKVHTSLKQEAPLYRDEEGRLRRRRSPSPPPMMKTSLSLPNLPAMSDNASGEKRVSGRGSGGRSGRKYPEIDITCSEGTEEDVKNEIDLSWSPKNGSPAALLSPVASDSGCKGVDEAEEVSGQVNQDPATPVLEETLDAADVKRTQEDVCVTEVVRGDTPVIIFFTVRHSFQRELKIVMSTIQGSIRSCFADDVVKLGEFVVEDERQGVREQQKRYQAWGQDALRTQEQDALKAPALAALRLTVTVTHKSSQELKKLVNRVVDQICGCFPSSILQVREVTPPLWSSSPRPTPKRPLRDGLGRPMPTAWRSSP